MEKIPKDSIYLICTTDNNDTYTSNNVEVMNRENLMCRHLHIVILSIFLVEHDKNMSHYQVNKTED